MENEESQNTEYPPALDALGELIQNILKVDTRKGGMLKTAHGPTQLWAKLFGIPNLTPEEVGSFKRRSEQTFRIWKHLELCERLVERAELELHMLGQESLLKPKLQDSMRKSLEKVRGVLIHGLNLSWPDASKSLANLDGELLESAGSHVARNGDVPSYDKEGIAKLLANLEELRSEAFSLDLDPLGQCVLVRALDEAIFALSNIRFVDPHSVASAGFSVAAVSALLQQNECSKSEKRKAFNRKLAGLAAAVLSAVVWTSTTSDKLRESVDSVKKLAESVTDLVGSTQEDEVGED